MAVDGCAAAATSCCVRWRRGARWCWRCCHLEAEGFRGAPRVVGDGIDEVVTFVRGESPHPRAWADDAVAAIGVMLGALHRATASFVAPAGIAWHPWFGRDLRGSRPSIGHCDTAPWNIIARGGQPVAFVDWENCGPVDARWELVQTVWLNAQLHDDDVAEPNGLPDTSTRARQARLILDGYGLPAREREGFVDAMVEFAIHSAAQEAIDARLMPNSALPVKAPGSSGGEPLSAHQVAWGVAWRTRAAAWMLRNRALLERARHVDDELQLAREFASVLGRSSTRPRRRDGGSDPGAGASHSRTPVGTPRRIPLP